MSERMEQVTGCVLAGGQGSRMGGIDKGLQPFAGQPLVAHALARLAPQVDALLINANRHWAEYTRLGRPYGAAVVPDAQAHYPGPLAGFLAGLSACRTAWLLTVPCDTPLFPDDVCARMLAAAVAQATDGQAVDIVVAYAPELRLGGAGATPAVGALRAQPVFCLMRATLQASLAEFIGAGGRKIDAWTARHRCARADWPRAREDGWAFANANTLAELELLEAAAQSGAHPGRR